MEFKNDDFLRILIRIFSTKVIISYSLENKVCIISLTRKYKNKKKKIVGNTKNVSQLNKIKLYYLERDCVLDGIVIGQ